jgi:hypothetical protein
VSKEYGKINQRDNGKGKLVPIYPNKNDLNEATYQLNAYALNEGKEYNPRVRLNYDDGALWLDLGRQDWKCVRITADGWKVLDRCKAKWGEAACRKLGFRPGAFSEAYMENQGYAVQWFAEHDPICIGISEMMSRREEWRGKPEKLYRIIRALALQHQERFEGKFPATSAVMGKELPRSIGALRKVYGISVGRFRLDDGNKNGIEIWKVGKGRLFPSPGEGPEKDETELDF